MRQIFIDTIRPTLGIAEMVLFVFVFAAFGQISNENNTLEINRSLTRELSGGEIHFYKLKLKAGQFAQFTVVQKNIDVIVSLYAPDGKLQTVLNSQGGQLWKLTISAINDFDSEYKIEIKTVHQTALPGSYEITLNELRPGVATDVKRAVAQMFFSYGQKSNEVRDFEISIKQFEGAINLWRETGDQYWEAIGELNIGWTYGDSGENEKSLVPLNRSLKIFRDLNERVGETKALSALGNSYAKLGKSDSAIASLEQALILARENKLKRIEGIIYSNLGNIYKNLSLSEKSLTYYKQSLQILEESKEVYDEGQLLNNIGVVYSDLGNFQESVEYLKKALIISQETDNIFVMRNVFNNLGNIFFDFDKDENAEWAYQNSLTLSRELKDRSKEATTLNNLASIYIKSKQYEKARDYFEQSLAISREIKDPDTESFPLKNLFLMYVTLKNPQLAIFYGKQAINVFQQIRANIKNLDKESQQAFVEGKEKYYRILSDVLISKGRIPEAQTVLDFLKEEEFGQLNIRRSAENSDTLPYNKTEGEVILKIEKLASSGRKQVELDKLQKEKGSLSVEDQQQLNAVRTEIESANKAFRLALDALGKSEQSVENKVAEIQTEKNLQRLLGSLGKELKTGAVALYTVIGSEDVKDDNGNPVKNKTLSKFGWIILVTPESRKAYPIDVTDLEKTVFDFRAALSSDKYNPQVLAEKLYVKLFRQTSDKQKTTLEADLETYLKNYESKTIMWSLDGVLRYVPMAALHDGKAYFVEKYRNVMFTKQSLLLLNEKDSTAWKVLGLGVSEAKTVETASGVSISFQALNGAKRELEDIVHEPNEKTGILDGVRKLDNDFTKEKALTLWREGNFQVVHIASHFSFNPTDQTESFLLLGDGKLTFADIQDKDNLFGSVDLLTLSACDTAMGSNGKESEGFAYLAQSLGAKTVIASLWQVSDAGTPELMIQFYKLRSANGAISKGEAFRQAQLSMLFGKSNSEGPETKNNRAELVGTKTDLLKLPIYIKDGSKPFAHPYYWSSFVLIGNWR